MTISILLMMVCVGAFAQDHKTCEEIEGTWSYTADEAPYEYQKGKMVFYDEGGALKVKIEIQGFYIYAQNLKIEGSEIVCTAYVENERITIKLNLKDGKLDGNVDSSDGVIPVSLVKEDQKS